MIDLRTMQLAEQRRVLELLRDSCQAGEQPQGYSGRSIAEQLNLPIDEVHLTVAQLEDRGLVTTAGAAAEDPVGRVEITPAGHDAVQKRWDAPAIVSSERRKRAGMVVRRDLRDMGRLVLAGLLGGLFAALFLKLLGGS